MRIINMAVLSVGLGLFMTCGAFAATWTGAGEDNLWSNPANWNGDVPSGATAVATFDGTSVKDCAVNVEEVGVLTIAAGYSGTISLVNALQVNASFAQAAGTFVCGAHDLTVGQNGGKGHSTAAYKGDILLTGGAFSAPSGTLTWKPYRNNDVVFRNEGVTFDANGGTILVDYDVGSDNAMGWTLYSSEKTYYNLTFRSNKDGGNRLAGTMNVVSGTLRTEGCRINCTTSTDVADYTKKPIGFVVNGDVEYAVTAFGGSVTLLFNGAADQEIRFSRESEDAEPRGFGMVIDKPEGGKVTVTSSFGKAYFGAGLSTWDCKNTIGGKEALSCIAVKRGELDMSSLDEVQVNGDNGAVFACESTGTIKYPTLLSVSNRRPFTFMPFDGQVLRDLTLRGGVESATDDFPKSSRNTVSGDLTLDGVAFNGGVSTDISTVDKWQSSCGQIGGLVVLGDVHLKNTLGNALVGGTGQVLMSGSDDQTIHIYDGGACLPTLQIDKAAGKVTCISETEGLPLALASSGDSANGGSLVLTQGEIEFPPAGVLFANLHNQALLQLGGTMNIQDVPLTLAHRKSFCYNLYVLTKTPLGSVTLQGQVLQPLTGTVQEITGDVRVENPGTGISHFEGPTESITWALTGDRDQTYFNDGPNMAFYNSGSSVNGGLRIAKTGGTLTLQSPLSVRNLTLADGTSLAFPIVKPEGATTDRGEAGANDPVVQVARDLRLPAAGTVNLTSTTSVRGGGPTKWNVFGYNNVYDFATTSFVATIPNATRPKMKNETAEKILYLQYREAKGLVLMYR